MASEIAVIDLAQISSTEALAKAVVEAAKDLGFLYLKHTGLEAQAKEMFEISQSFFLEQSEEEKEACTMTTKNQGYSRPGQESLDPSKPGDKKEVFNIGICHNAQAQQPLPPLLAAHLKTISDFQISCHTFCARLLEAFSVGLGLPANHFTDQHTYDSPENVSALRLLHYPAPNAQHSTASNRAGAHSDYGSLTLLFQQAVEGGEGLQVLPPSKDIDDSSAWISVPVIEDAVLVNIGDAFEYWSSCAYKSTLHRVVSAPYQEGGPNHDRWSMAYFLQPDASAVLQPVLPVQDVTPSDMKRLERKGVKFGTSLTSLQHLQMRLNSTYVGRREL